LGLGDLEKPAELWSVVVGNDGKEYPNMFRCNSIKQLEEDEPELSDALNKVFQKWYIDTGKEAADKILTTLGKDGGYSYKHTDGNTYKFGKYKGQLQLTRIKGGSWGGKKGTFTFMRTEAVRLGPVDIVNQTLTSQGPTDSWKITKVAGESMKDMLFLMEKQASYTPTTVTTTTTEKSKDATKEASQEDSED
jgi:hypothetical protein